MTVHPRHWCRQNGEHAQLVHVNQDGLALVSQTAHVVATLDARLTSGEDGAAVLHDWGRIPWRNLQWFEWSSSLEVRWRYEVPGHGSHTASFVVGSGAEREILIETVANYSGMTKSERRRTLPEMAKGPLATVGIAVTLGGILWWSTGAAVSGGGRTAARAAVITTVASMLGHTGIAALTLVGAGAGVAVLAMRLAHPPLVGRLVQASPR